MGDTLITILVYAALILLAVLACTVVAAVIKFVLRFFVRQIKFVVCFVVALCLIGGLLLKLAVKPIQNVFGGDVPLEGMTEIVDQFKGFYYDALPLLAWRFTDISDSEDETRVRIEYLPLGSIEVVYDRQDHTFSIDKPLKTP